MYESKYYTCEEIDQRLLQNYYDDLVASGYTGTKKEYQKLILSIADKVNLEIGKGLSTNDFTNELKEKLDKLKDITKVSELINDASYQNKSDVGEIIKAFYKEKVIKALHEADWDNLELFISNVDIFIKDMIRLLGDDGFNLYKKLTQNVEQLIKDVRTLKSQPIPGVWVLTESEIEDIFKELI